MVDPDEMFREYLWVSGTTETQRRHFAELAAEAAARLPCSGRQRSALDIGCNDGTLLDALACRGLATYGVDPARNLHAITAAKGHQVTADCWSPAVALALRLAHAPFDLITATNVLAHCDDVHEFLVGCRRALSVAGHLVVEFPYARHTLDQRQFDQVYHEHLSYFLVAPFRRLCDATGFSIAQVTETPIHGGSIRFTLTPADRARHIPEVSALETAERGEGLLGDRFYAAFSGLLEAQYRQLRVAIGECVARGYKLVAYGASAKANTMLNYWPDVCPAYVVDDNPFKCGRYTPGRYLPIVSASTLRSERGRLAILLTAWNFADEIAQRLSALGRRGDLLLTYVPTVRVATLE